MENIWQFSKVYSQVPYSRQTYSRYDSTVIWEYPEEQHIMNNQLTQEYVNWRNKGMYNPYAVRYPVGYNHRHACVCSITDSGERCDYITARKKIYLPYYISLVKQTSEFHELKNMLNQGINLLIIEVDGPHQESLEYYKNKYSVSNNFIEGNTMLITPENINIMLNDDKHAFGHGYCLSMALLDMGW